MGLINQVIKMTKEDYNIMLDDLKNIKTQLDSNIDSIDVRLCIDVDQLTNPNWIIRSGLADYDQRHSLLCGASSVDKSTNCVKVLEDLINQCLDQIVE